ncbi:MAG: glutaminyl-peptide cyclotransferase [Chloroflexota bacterium]
MKYFSVPFLLLIALCACLLTACDGRPLATATLAPTAALPAETSATTQPPDAQAADATASETDATPAASAAAPDTVATDAAATEVAYAAVVVTAPDTPAPTPTEPATPSPTPPPTYTYRIINTYPHDPAAFTQGLIFVDGELYEGTGRWGESTLREVALATGAVLRSRPLDAQYFGEGITLLGDKIYQLTWQDQTGFVYDRDTFEPLQTFTYPHEGWGITQDGTRLIVSDGTATIRFWDPETLQETGQITVRDNEGPLNRLNELEFINGEIWAHIWLTDLIARISPETGDVLGYIDLTGLLDTSTLTQPVDVLNGLAFDSETGRIFVTGKLWPSLFEIEVIPAP